jgi:hypothetical protein
VACINNGGPEQKRRCRPTIGGQCFAGSARGGSNGTSKCRHGAAAEDGAALVAHPFARHRCGPADQHAARRRGPLRRHVADGGRDNQGQDRARSAHRVRRAVLHSARAAHLRAARVRRAHPADLGELPALVPAQPSHSGDWRLRAGVRRLSDRAGAAHRRGGGGARAVGQAAGARHSARRAADASRRARRDRLRDQRRHLRGSS